jgi:hypothetical protein
LSYEVKHEEKCFWVSDMEILKTSQKLHLRVTKKDPSLPFHFHVLSLFKYWSSLGFDQDSNGHKNSGKIKNLKTKARSLLTSYISIVSIFK